MKFSKVMASAAALTMVASMAIPVSAATSEAYMYTVQKSWNGKAPADQEETPIKFMFEDDGVTPKTKKGATDLNKWDSGTEKFNGQWAQIILTDNDLSAITIDFTIELDENSTVEWHADDPDAAAEDNVYQVFNVFGTGGQIINTCPHAEINEGLGEHEENEFVNTGAHTFTYSYTGADIQAAVDADAAKFNQNEDGTSTLGFNIQVGHFTGAKVTATVKSSTGNIYDGAAAEGGNTDSSAAPTDSSSKKADDASSAKSDDSSKAGTTSTANNAGGTTKTTGTATSAAGGGSDATDKTAATGATAGLVFAGIALAGAALVVTKRK